MLSALNRGSYRAPIPSISAAVRAKYTMSDGSVTGKSYSVSSTCSARSSRCTNSNRSCAVVRSNAIPSSVCTSRSTVARSIPGWTTPS